MALASHAEAELINQFNNLVLPKINISDRRGIPPIADNSGTAGDDDEITLDEGLDILFGFQKLVADINADGAAPRPLIDDLNALDDLLQEKAANALANNFGPPVGIEVTINVPGASAISQALGGLSSKKFVDSGDVRAAFNVVASTDPFVSFQGSITNTSATEPLSLFVPFEEAFIAPIELDADLLREVVVEVSVEDTNGDGVASVRQGDVSFLVSATEDPTAPDGFNTDDVGTFESVGVSRIALEAPKRNVSNARPINRSRIDRVEEGSLISHLRGDFRLFDISPGDTANFTAVISLGIVGDPLVPLIPTRSVEGIFVAGNLLGTGSGAVPEPSSALLAWFAMAATVLRRKRQ